MKTTDFVFTVVLFTTISGFVHNEASLGPPHTVKHLDAVKYLGRWYQVYTSPSVVDTFQKGAECVTADYALTNDSRISVLNSERVGSPTGPVKVIHGFAMMTGITGQLTVTLGNVSIALPYWVLKLGPETSGPKKLYKYSVISDNNRAALFVLARNITDFKAEYEPEVLQFLNDNGFTTIYNHPVETYQGSDCLYNTMKYHS